MVSTGINKDASVLPAIGIWRGGGGILGQESNESMPLQLHTMVSLSWLLYPLYNALTMRIATKQEDMMTQSPSLSAAALPTRIL